MIEARELSRSFDGRAAIAGLSFTVPEGKLCALLGPNGAGKTTTVRLLLGLLSPSSGTARVAGIALPAGERDGARLRARTGLLTETPGFYDRISGRENLELFGTLYGLGGAEVRRRSEDWLHRLGLWEARDRPFATWSKGMKQRLALIRAVLHEPGVLFLDEPTAGLDPEVARAVRDLIAGLRREGRTILLCTHNLAEAQELADLVGILRCRMLAFGPPESLGPGGAVLTVTVQQVAGALLPAIRVVPGVRGVVAEGPVLHIEVDDLPQDTPAVVRAIVEGGGAILEVRRLAASLEDVYLRAVREMPA